MQFRLADIETIIDAAGAEDCAPRLDQARSALEGLAVDPILSILPMGPARLAKIQHALHLARAGCAGLAPRQPDNRQSELRAAADAALRAVALYRDAFNYQDMVVMQFDAAVTSRQLGDKPASLALLRTAIAMDFEFGYDADAEENLAVLRRWGGEPASTPARPIAPLSLVFDWSDSEADLTIDVDLVALIGDQPIHSHGRADLRRQILEGFGHWLVKHDQSRRRYDFSEWPNDRLLSERHTAAYSLLARLMPPDYEVGGTGQFSRLADGQEFTGLLDAEMQSLLGGMTQAPQPRAGTPAALAASVEYFSNVPGLSLNAAQDQELIVATWRDAMLEQGVWYDMSLPLTLPNTAIPLSHDIQFVLARWLPCDDSPAAPRCVEILLHATPNAAALADLAKKTARNPQYGPGTLAYWSTTDLRLVTEPSRLMPHLYELRRCWYINIDQSAEPVIGSQRDLVHFDYRRHAAGG